MISYEVVVAEIAKHVVKAQSAMNDTQIREELSAIRALCDVALHVEGAKPSSTNHIPKMMISTEPQLPQQTSVQATRTLNANKLQEDDANGDSIFDF